METPDSTPEVSVHVPPGSSFVIISMRLTSVVSPSQNSTDPSSPASNCSAIVIDAIEMSSGHELFAACVYVKV